jgi:hypothetical protein
MSARDENRKRKMQAIRKAIDILSGDNAYDNIECVILSIKRFPEEVQAYLWEALAEVQDAFLPGIGTAGAKFLEEKLERMERNK